MSLKVGAMIAPIVFFGKINLELFCKIISFNDTIQTKAIVRSRWAMNQPSISLVNIPVRPINTGD